MCVFTIGGPAPRILLIRSPFPSSLPVLSGRYQSLTDKTQLDSNPELYIHIIPDKTNNTLTIIDSGIGMTKVGVGWWVSDCAGWECLSVVGAGAAGAVGQSVEQPGAAAGCWPGTRIWSLPSGQTFPPPP